MCAYTKLNTHSSYVLYTIIILMLQCSFCILKQNFLSSMKISKFGNFYSHINDKTFYSQCTSLYKYIFHKNDINLKSITQLRTIKLLCGDVQNQNLSPMLIRK